MELPGVKDGMRMDNRRTSCGYDERLACARGELFGTGNAQLPLPPMPMFDRISEIAEAGGEYGKGLMRASLDLKPDLWFFPCHFKGDPEMPGRLGVDGELKFSGQVLPTVKEVNYSLEIKRVMRKLVLG